MNNPEKRWDIVDKIVEKIKLRIIKKEPIQKFEDEIALGEVPGKFFVSYDTLFRVIRNYEELSESKKKEYLKYGQDLNKGGLRKSLQKISDDTILCMIVLILDFPTLSAESIATYLNSKYGPNYQYSKKVSKRTVQRYLKHLKFGVKKASFAPPNRNSIGLRIYRVAWCKIIEKILQNENTLIAFVDEASVTTCEGRAYGRSYAAITPVLNIPLSKVHVTIVAIVIPCYGVLYKFIENACTGDEYALFLKEALLFIRKYICNKDTEIVIIEDNCPIHSTDKVEQTIQELKIALLPIVPYSPCLNECVEGYFGLSKSKNIMTSIQNGEIASKCEIETNWMFINNNYIDDSKTVSLFKEWKSRMETCKEGKPILSNHTESNTFPSKEIYKNLEVTVDRIQNI